MYVFMCVYNTYMFICIYIYIYIHYICVSYLVLQSDVTSRPFPCVILPSIVILLTDSIAIVRGISDTMQVPRYCKADHLGQRKTMHSRLRTNLQQIKWGNCTKLHCKL